MSLLAHSKGTSALCPAGAAPRDFDGWVLGGARLPNVRGQYGVLTCSRAGAVFRAPGSLPLSSPVRQGPPACLPRAAGWGGVWKSVEQTWVVDTAVRQVEQP